MDAIALLLNDHRLLRQLSEKLADTTERAIETRKKLLKRLETELKAHTAIEEELFYPAFLDASDDVEDARRVAEGIEEHRACDQKVIPDHLSSPGGGRGRDVSTGARADRSRRPEGAWRADGDAPLRADGGHGVRVQPC